MASCSFYPAHHITMGEGGFVACKDKATEDILRSFREWGRGCYCVGPEANKLKCGSCKCRFSNWIPALPDQIFDHKYVYDEIGYNIKPIELQGSMGLVQLEKLPVIERRRRENYAALFSKFEKYEKYFVLPKARAKSDPSWFAFALTVRPDAPFTRTEIVDFLEDQKIQTRPYFAGNIMLQPAYDHLMPAAQARDDFPVASYVMLNTFFLGTSPVVQLDQIEYIGMMVDEFMRRFE
jgi:CDP-6-deoxy-D-xylo-4-hexulose-3-dehydrase